jgi:hypothetical protein
LASVASRINNAPGAPGKLTAQIDAVGKRLVLKDLSVGSAEFNVKGIGGSFAAVGLGIAGQEVVVDGAAHYIYGKALHGDTLGKHVYVVEDSAATPAKLSGSLSVAATNVNAEARLGFVGVAITGANGSASASVEVKLKDDSPDNRVTVPELLDSVATAITSATTSGQAHFDLPLTIRPEGLITGGTPLVTVDWSDPSLTVADGTNPSGQPHDYVQRRR